MQVSPPITDEQEADVVERAVEALAGIPAGPALGTALAALDPSRLTGQQWVDVLVARYRQGNHERGELFAAIGQVLLHRLPTSTWKVKEPDEFAVDEVRAALTLTRTAAQDVGALVWDLHSRMPSVTEAMRAGLIDQPRARVFSAWTADLSDAHTQAVVAALLPTAPGMTTGQLIDAIKRHAIALDPEWARRRYERALRGRRVVGRRNPDGTASLSGYELPLDRVAAACARLDGLARAAKTAGHPDRLDHLRADLFLGMTDGRYAAMTDQQILATLLATIPPTPTTDPDGEDPDGEDPDGEDPDGEDPDGEDPDGEDPDDGGPDDGGPDDPDHDGDSPDREGGNGEDSGLEDSGLEDSDGEGSGGEDRADGLAGGGVGRRGGLRLWAGLPTLVGADRRPAELIGWGPIHAELARDLALAIGSWWCILTDTDGAPQAILPIRRRPTIAPTRGRVRGEVWIQVTPDRLTALTESADTDTAWSGVIAEITAKTRTARRGPPTGDQTARLPGAALRRWIHIRHRHCVFPGCRAPAHRGDADHGVEHARGGPTAETNLTPPCRHDHRLRHDGGWTLKQTAPPTRHLDQPARPHIPPPPPTRPAHRPARPHARRRPRRRPRPPPRRHPARVGPRHLPRTRGT